MSTTAPQFEPTAVLYILQAEFGTFYNQAELHALAQDIAPYLARTALALPDAVVRIGRHYRLDGPRVRRLLASPDAPEWQQVLVQVYSFATANRKYPSDLDGSSWPDIDAFEDIRRKLRSYNFEGSLDNWISVTVVRRLTRFWRDQQTLRVGGPGIRPRDEREQAPTGARARTRSLNALDRDQQHLLDQLEDEQLSVAELVEAAELQLLLDHCVRSFALAHNDPALMQIWHAVVDRRVKLREVAQQFGLSIAQVNRRIEQVRAHLRQHPMLLGWLNLSD